MTEITLDSRHSRPKYTSYLKKNLKDILPRALAEICQTRPEDPIDYLARYLYRSVDCEMYYHEKAIFAKEMQLMTIRMKAEEQRRLNAIAAHKKQIAELKPIISLRLSDHMAEDIILRLSTALRDKKFISPSRGSEILDQKLSRTATSITTASGQEAQYVPYTEPLKRKVRKAKEPRGIVSARGGDMPIIPGRVEKGPIERSSSTPTSLSEARRTSYASPRVSTDQDVTKVTLPMGDSERETYRVSEDIGSETSPKIDKSVAEIEKLAVKKKKRSLDRTLDSITALKVPRGKISLSRSTTSSIAESIPEEPRMSIDDRIASSAPSEKDTAESERRKTLPIVRVSKGSLVKLEVSGEHDLARLSSKERHGARKMKSMKDKAVISDTKIKKAAESSYTQIKIETPVSETEMGIKPEISDTDKETEEILSPPESTGEFIEERKGKKSSMHKKKRRIKAEISDAEIETKAEISDTETETKETISPPESAGEFIEEEKRDKRAMEKKKRRTKAEISDAEIETKAEISDTETETKAEISVTDIQTGEIISPPRSTGEITEEEKMEKRAMHKKKRRIKAEESEAEIKKEAQISDTEIETKTGMSDTEIKTEEIPSPPESAGEFFEEEKMETRPKKKKKRRIKAEISDTEIKTEEIPSPPEITGEFIEQEKKEKRLKHKKKRPIKVSDEYEYDIEEPEVEPEHIDIDLTEAPGKKRQLKKRAKRVDTKSTDEEDKEKSESYTLSESEQDLRAYETETSYEEEAEDYKVTESHEEEHISRSATTILGSDKTDKSAVDEEKLEVVSKGKRRKKTVPSIVVTKETDRDVISEFEQDLIDTEADTKPRRRRKPKLGEDGEEIEPKKRGKRHPAKSGLKFTTVEEFELPVSKKSSDRSSTMSIASIGKSSFDGIKTPKLSIKKSKAKKRTVKAKHVEVTGEISIETPEEVPMAPIEISDSTFLRDTSLTVSVSSSSTEESVVPEEVITPVECEWLLTGPRILVCRHPVLGEIRAQPESISNAQNIIGWSDRTNYAWQAIYDPEFYTVVDLFVDDAKYKRRKTRRNTLFQDFQF